MFIARLVVKNFGPIDDFDHTFKAINPVVGMNGKGKTHLLDLMATLAGNDEATAIAANRISHRQTRLLQGVFRQITQKPNRIEQIRLPHTIRPRKAGERPEAHLSID